MDIASVQQWFKTHKNALYSAIDACQGEAIDTLLGSRDQAAFDSAWITAHRRNEAYKAMLPLTDKSKMESCASSIARDAFLYTMRATASSELAASIADDFHLIAEAMLSNMDYSFAYALLDEYRQGRIPANGMAMHAPSPLKHPIPQKTNPIDE